MELWYFLSLFAVVSHRLRRSRGTLTFPGWQRPAISTSCGISSWFTNAIRAKRLGVTPLVAALREQHVACALWLIHRGAVAEIKAGMIASLTGHDLTTDQQALEALVGARHGDILAALVCEIRAAGSRLPDCLLQAFVDAEWTSALYRDDGVLDERPTPPPTERARPRRQEIPELAQPPSMHRHAASFFPVLPQNILAPNALDKEDRAPWASGLEACDFPNAPSLTKHVNEPNIVVFPGQCRASIARAGELAIRQLWWPSFRAGDGFTVHFSQKAGSFITASRDDLCKLARRCDAKPVSLSGEVYILFIGDRHENVPEGT
jgi:hypothetical protein